MLPLLILIVASLDSKLGVIDYQGNIIIPFEHEKLYRFQDGRYVASKYIQSAEGQQLLYGAYNEKGQVVIPFVFDELSWATEGCITGIMNGKSIVIDLDGNILFTSEYDHIGAFSSLGYAGVAMGGKKGIINRKFEEIIAPTFDWINHSNRYGRWHVKWTADKREALVDSQHAFVFTTPANHVIKNGGILSRHLITYDNNNRFQAGLFSLAGELVLPHVYNDLSFNTRAIYNSDYEPYHLPTYIHGLNNSLQTSELFLLTDTGSCQLQCSYPIIQPGNGIDRFVFGTESNGKKSLGLMNGQCEVLVEPQFEEIYHMYQEGEWINQPVLYRTLQDGKYGLMQGDGEEIFKPQFSKFISAGPGLFKKDDQVTSVIFNMKGEIVFESDTIYVLYRIDKTENDFTARTAAGRHGVYSIEKKNWIIPPIYDDLQFADIVEE